MSDQNLSFEAPQFYIPPAESDDGGSYDDELEYVVYNRLYEENYDSYYPVYHEEVEDLKVVDDDDYSEIMGLPTPVEFPDKTCIRDDICALVAGVLMAKSDKLDTGLTSEEFDYIIQEVTGKREGQYSNFIRLEDLSFFVQLTPDEIDKAIKEKGNILLNKMFDDILSFSVIAGTYKMKIEDQSPLRELYESIKSSGANRKKRQELAEKVKTDKMCNLQNRRRYMISNNLLVELIAKALDKEYLQVVDYNKVRDAYCTMMTEETELYHKYNHLLNLDKIKRDIGNMLNQQSTRDLFGRGTITKALSNPIYKNIDWTNNGKILFKKNRHKTLEEMTYGKEAFEEINAAIEEDNREKRRNQRKFNHQPNKEEREAIEREKRKETYEPTNWNSANIFIPGMQPETTTFFGRPSSKPEPSAQAITHISRRDTVETLNNNKYNERASSPEISLSETSMTETSMTFHKSPAQKFIFGSTKPAVKMDHNAQQSFVSKPEKKEEKPPEKNEEEILYTDDEDEPPKPKKVVSKRVSKHVAETVSHLNSPRRSIPSRSPSASRVGAWDTPLHPRETPKEIILPSPPRVSKSVMHPNENTARVPRQNMKREASQPPSARHVNQNQTMRSPFHESRAVVPTENYSIQENIASYINSPSPQSVQQGELFINYIVTHVYLHRHIEGAPRRYWSQIEKYLDFPFSKPETLLGPNWMVALQQNTSVSILQTSNDYLFEWGNNDFDMSFSVASRMRY